MGDVHIIHCVGVHLVVAWGFSGAVPGPAANRCLGKAGLPDILEEAQGQEAKEKEKLVWEAEQFQASSPEGGRPAELDASGPRTGWYQTCPQISGRVWCREKRYLRLGEEWKMSNRLGGFHCL